MPWPPDFWRKLPHRRRKRGSDNLFCNPQRGCRGMNNSRGRYGPRDDDMGENDGLLRVPPSGQPLRGPGRRTRRDDDGFHGKGSDFPHHDLCLFHRGRDGGRLG
jgi:hypothetical protein